MKDNMTLIYGFYYIKVIKKSSDITEYLKDMPNINRTTCSRR